MAKKLSEMALTELWQLFPISLTEPQGCWRERYQGEALLLQNTLANIARISHIGSTAVGSIWAKPIIDILLEMPMGYDLAEAKDTIIGCGYRYMSERENGISFNKGYTEDGFAEKVFHLHVRHLGDNDELYFRDYLIAHADAAKEYEALKLHLWKMYEHNRDGYTNAKTEFIRRHTERAKILYAGRYV